MSPCKADGCDLSKIQFSYDCQVLKNLRPDYNPASTLGFQVFFDAYFLWFSWHIIFAFASNVAPEIWLSKRNEYEHK